MLRHTALSVLRTVVLALVLAPTTAPAVIGGNPGDMIFELGSLAGSLNGSGLAITENGVFFAITVRADFTATGGVAVLRSEDRGQSWSVWSILDDPSGGIIRDPMVQVTSDPSSEILVISYRVDGSTDEIWVCSTVATAHNPNWSKVLIESSVGDASGFPRLSRPRLVTRSSLVGPATIGVTYSVETASYDYEYRYAVSHNAGVTYQGPVVAVDLSPPAAGLLQTEAYLGFGSGGTVHLAVSRMLNSTVPGYSKVNVLTAANDGAAAADWAVPATLLSDVAMAGGDGLAFASDPLGEDIVVRYREPTGVDSIDVLQVSQDGGATWSPGTITEPAGLQNFRLAWTPLGPMATAFRDSTYWVLQSEGGILGPYESTPFLRSYDSTGDLADLALDPSQGFQAAIVATMSLEDSLKEVWFNAEWRDEPGYAVAQTEWGHQLNDEFEHCVGALGVADLDGDGLAEILAVTNRDTLWAFRGGDGTRRSYGLGAAGSASVPVLTDLDGDALLEVIVGGDDGLLHILDRQLNPLTAAPVDLGVSTPLFVSAGAVTGTNAAEIVALGDREIHLLDATGTELPGWPHDIQVDLPPVGRAAIGDVDGDAETEVVVAFSGGVRILGPDASAEGSVLIVGGLPSGGVTLVDIDDDGDLEIAVPMADGTVELLHHDGTSVGPAWPYDTGTGSRVLSVSVARLRDDQSEALCFSTESGGVFAVGVDGFDLNGYPVAIDSGDTAVNEPVIARVARPGSDRPQLLLNTDNGWLHEWQAQGQTPADWPNFYDQSPALSPVVEDVDADGIAEIVLAVGNRIYVFDTGTAPLSNERRRWPMVGHDLARSGCADCGLDDASAVLDPLSLAQTRVAFTGAAPNPTPGRTAFSFALPAAGEVELAVYDLRGRRVRSFGRQDLGVGQHQVTWDGRDQRGANVASGVYLARLVVGSGRGREVLTRSVVLQR